MSEFYSIKEVCQILKCSRNSVSLLCMPDKRTGLAKLENVRIGKIIRVPKEALEAFIRRRYVRAE